MIYDNIIGIVLLFVLFVFIVVYEIFKKSSTELSTTMMLSGVGLVTAAFPGFKEIILSICAKIFEIKVSVEDNYMSIACGSLLIFFGWFLRKDIKERIFVLNMLGLYSQKEISDAQNIKDLKLVDFKVKEVIIDFVDIFNNGPMTTEKNQLIVDKVKKQCEAFSNRSKEFISCYTGMAPIPYTILAGTRLSGCNLKRFFEFKRTDNKYYELKTKAKKIYDQLNVIYPQSPNLDSTEVVVALSITRGILKDDLVQFGCFDLIKISLDKPKDNLIVSNEQLDDYGNKILNTIESIKNKYSKINKVHFVASIPSCVSIKLGMLFALSNNRLPQIISYHFVQSNIPKYPFGIIVSDSTVDGCGKLVEV